MNSASVSFTKGYSFFFKYNNHLIEAWFSMVSGAEKVFVDGKLVSEQRNYKRHSTSSFNIDGDVLSTSLTAVSLLKGPYICTLAKDGIAINKKTLKFSQVSFLIFALYIFFGLSFGFAHDYFQWPSWTLFLAVALLLFSGFLRRNKHQPVIEEEVCHSS